MTFSWVTLAADDREVSRSETFATREEAEAWMGANWSDLVEQGGDKVRLLEGDRAVYDMGLGAG